MIELRQLRNFTAIVDAGSLTRAAAAVHIAQPAMSQLVAALESEIGVRLLNRTVKGVTPTEQGLALYRHAQVLLKLAAETRNVTLGTGGRVSGRVRIGLPSTIAVILVAPLLKVLKEQFPGILLEVYESPSSYLATQLLEERVDLSILVDETPSSGLRVEPLVDEQLYFIHSRKAHPFKCRKSLGLKAIGDVSIVLPARSTTLRQLVDLAFRAANIEPNVQAETSSIQTLLTLVALGGMGTFVPYSALSWHTSNASLCASIVTPHIIRRAWLASSGMVSLTQASNCVRVTIQDVVRKMVENGSWLGATLRY